jgi:hypothetical protein
MAYMHANNNLLFSTALTTSETQIGYVGSTNFTAPDVASTGVLVTAVIELTSTTTGTTVTFKIRSGNGTSGTALFTSNALPQLTGELTESVVVQFTDTSNTSNNPSGYSITATASAGAEVTINSITTSAQAVDVDG